MKNKQAGDGAVILCNWMLHIQKGGDRFKVTKITSVIRSIWGLPAMDFTTRNIWTEYELNTKNMKNMKKNSRYQIWVSDGVQLNTTFYYF